MSVDSTNAVGTYESNLLDQPLAVTFRFPGALRHTLKHSQSQIRVHPAHREDRDWPTLAQTCAVVSQIMPLTDAASASDYLGRTPVKAERVS